MPTPYILHTTKNNRSYVKGEKIGTQIQRGTKKKTKTNTIIETVFTDHIITSPKFFSIIMRQTTD